jgi:hypothetical protein
MISSQAHDLAGALAKSLGLDDQCSIGEACHLNDGRSDKEFAHLKIRVDLHDDKELHSPAGADEGKLPIDADSRQAVHEVDQGSDQRSAAGWRLARTFAFGVLISVMVGAVYAWQFYGDVHRTQMVDAVSSSNVVPVRVAFKTSDRVSAQDHGAELVLPPEQVRAAPSPSPELRQQLEAMASDIAVVRHIVERLAAIQEQMAVDIAMLQKSDQKASLPPNSASVPAPPRKTAPNIAHSAAAHLPSPPVLTAPAQTPLALH